MNPAELKSIINSTDWYRQGGALRPYYISFPLYVAGQHFDMINYFSDDVCYGYFNKQQQRKIAERVLSLHLRDPEYLEREYIRPWRTVVELQDRFTQRMSLQYLSGLSNDALFQFLGKFIDLQCSAWDKCIVIEVYDPWGDVLLTNHIEQEHAEIHPEHLSILIGPQSLTFSQREERDRYQLEIRLREGEDISFDLEQHAHRYHWIHNSWADVFYRDSDYFRARIDQHLSQDAEEVTSAPRELEQFSRNQRLRRQQLAEHYMLSDTFKAVCHFFSLLTDWRDERKAQVCEMNHYTDLFLRELANRSGVGYRDLQFLDAHEVRSLDDIHRLADELPLRREGAIHFLVDGCEIRWLIGEQAEQYHAALQSRLESGKEIRGSIAQKGVIRGRVKKIVFSDDFSKMHEGDILVTQMTRPEYMPIIRKAGAIVTDEGGITCHAAIVSRELGIPCIVGTQVATSVLKDGDMVEVDADEGIVRKM